MEKSPKELFQKLPPHLLILGILGLIFVIVGNPLDTGGETKDQEQINDIQENGQNKQIPDRNTDESAYKAQLEKELEQILSSVTGAGEVQVMLSLEGGSKLDLVKNKDEEQTITEEADSAEGERKTKEMFSNKDVLTFSEKGEEQPMAVRELKPEIRGVVIVTEGGENLSIVKQLIQAANTLFGVPEHNIQVLPKK